ncbi:MAG: hypothetical protein NUW37_14930 [Planctomycetes bacterium]|nr:hypothetical protein [Planctomycetota bacterium]
MSTFNARVLAIVSILFAAVSCAYEQNPGGAPPVHVGGSVVLGTFSSGTLSVYTLASDGTKGDLIVTTDINSSGQFGFTIERVQLPVLIEIDSGGYVEEASGSSVQVTGSGDMLESIGSEGMIENIQNGTAIDQIILMNLTPITHIASKRIRVQMQSGQNVDEAVAKTEKTLGELFDIPGFRRITPADLSNTSVDTESMEALYGAVIAGLSQLAANLSTDNGESLNSIDIALLLGEDGTDGSFDGKINGEAVLTGGGHSIPTKIAGSVLSDAISEFVDSSRNVSGVTATDIVPTRAALATVDRNVGTVTTGAARRAMLFDLATASTNVTTIRNVGFKIVGAADASLYIVSETRNTKPAVTNPEFAPTPDTFELSDGVGLKTVYVWVKTPEGEVKSAGPVTITYGTAGTVDFSSSSSSTTSESGNFNVPVKITTQDGNPLVADITVSIAVTGGSATLGSDYSSPASTVTISKGKVDGGTVNLALPILADTLLEGPETVILTITSVASPGAIGTVVTHTVTISDDEDGAVISFQDATFATTDESAADHDVTVLLTLQGLTSLQDAMTISVASASGSATSGIDFTAVSETLTFAAGSVNGTTKTVTISVIADTSSEGNEDLTLSLSGVSANGSLGTQSTHTFTITDDDVIGTVQFVSVSSKTTNETAGNFAVKVLLTISAGTLSAPLTVNVASTDVSAAAGSDFTAVDATVTFPVGSGSGSIQEVNVPVLADGLIEGEESLSLTISNPSQNGVLGTKTTHVVTIADDDLATISFESSSSTTTGDSAGNFPVTLVLGVAQGTAPEVTVKVVSASGTAISGTDFTAVDATVTFAAGSANGATQTVNLPLLSDTLIEESETMTLTVSTPTGFSMLGSTTSHTVTIVDSQVPATIAFASASSATTSEAAGNHAVTVTLSTTGSATLSSEVTCSVASSSGTATSETDFTAVGATVTFAAGSGNGSTQTVNFPVLADTLIEGDETAMLTLSNATGLSSLGLTTTHTVTITDDEAKATLAFTSATSATADESLANHEITVTISTTGGATLAYPVTVDVANTGGTATAGTDFVAVASTLTFAAGSANGDTQSVSIPVLADDSGEGNETVTLTISNQSSLATLGSQTTHTATITDDDQSWTVAFESATSSTTNEDGANHEVTLVLTVVGVDLENMATVTVTSTGGTATSGSDYTAVFDLAPFAQGDSNGATVTVNVPVLADTSVEGDETVVLTLSDPMSPLTLGAQTTHTVTIVEDDLATIAFQDQTSTFPGEAPASGANATVVLSTTNSATLASDLSVMVESTSGTATGGLDYSTVMETITFLAGSGDGGTQTVSVNIIEDVDIEGDETVVLTLSSPTAPASLGATATHTMTIADDDAPTVEFQMASSATVDETAQDFEITVMLTTTGGTLPSAVTVDVSSAGGGTATAGIDFTAVNETLTFAQGSASGDTMTFSVSILSDENSESNDNVVLTLSNVTGVGTLGAQTTHTLTITDDDPFVTLVGASSYFSSRILKLDTGTGATTSLTGYGLLGPGSVYSTVYNPNLDIFYGIDVFVRELCKIDLQNHTSSPIGATELQSANVIAFDENTNTIYTFDTGPKKLFKLDPNTGKGTEIGSVGFNYVYGLAFDPGSNTLYGVATGSDNKARLITINTSTGEGTELFNLGTIYTNSMTIDPGSNLIYFINNQKLTSLNTETGSVLEIGTISLGSDSLYSYSYGMNPAFDSDNDKLIIFSSGGGGMMLDSGGSTKVYEMNVTTAASTLVDVIGAPFINGMAYDSNADKHYGVSSTGYGGYGSDSTSYLFTVSKDDGSSLYVGATGFTSIGGLAYDPDTDTLYGVDSATKKLITIDTSTGQGTAVGAVGFDYVNGLAFDPNTDTLYGVCDFNTGTTYNSKLIRINTSIGAGTEIGLTGFRSSTGLDFDPDTNTLYGVFQGPTSGGINLSTSVLVSINTSSGAGSQVGYTGYYTGSLAFDTSSDKLYGAMTNGQGSLIEIDPSSGAGRSIGSFAGYMYYGMTVDSDTKTIYAIGQTNSILTVNPDDGTTSFKVQLDYSQLAGFPNSVSFSPTSIAYDTVADVLYAVSYYSNSGDSSQNGNNLFSINLDTGLVTRVGVVSTSGYFKGLAMDDSTNTLYTVNGNDRSLYSVDTTTGAASKIGTGLGFTGIQSLAYVKNDDKLVAVDAYTREYIEIDRTTGVGTSTLKVGSANVQGIVAR